MVYISSIGYKTKNSVIDVPYQNLLRSMTDEQLKQLFEENDVPTNSDFIAIIDSKVNVNNVYTRIEMEHTLEAYFGNSPEIALDWYNKEMERRSAEIQRQVSMIDMQNTIDNKVVHVQNQVDAKISETNNKITEMDQTKNTLISSVNTKIQQADNKIVDVEGRMIAIENEFDNMVDGTGFATKTYVDTSLLTKSDKSNTYTKSEVDVKIDNVIGGSTGSNVAYGTTVTTSDWILDTTLNLYYVTITHDLGTKRFVPTIIDSNTNDSIEAVYKVIDDNTVRFFNEITVDATVTIINGNATTEIAYAKIDDVNISSKRVLSSSKTTEELNKKSNEGHKHQITDIEGLTLTGNGVTYDNTTSGMTATNVQSAIDELFAEVNGQRVRGIDIANSLLSKL